MNYFDLEKYDFHLPSRLIAQNPAKIRDHARLFVYKVDDDEIFFDRFYNLHRFLPSSSLIVLNNTKVVPARFELFKETGGKVEVLFLFDQYEGGETIKFIANKKLVLGEKLYMENKRCLGEVVKQEKNIFSLKFSISSATLFKLLHRYGKMPIPPYIKKTSLSEKELQKRYQSVFAKKPFSIAAPTASLHFTKRVFRHLQEKKIRKVEITLHVGLGTFAPLREDNFLNEALHQEFFYISHQVEKQIASAKKNKRPIIAVGTTTVRALESFARGKSNVTDLFIYPPFEFKLVDILITNFHLPKSSLILLVDAFLQYKSAKRNIIDLYKIAIKEQFRFYSFGDAMLIL